MEENLQSKRFYSSRFNLESVKSLDSRFKLLRISTNQLHGFYSTIKHTTTYIY